MSDDAPRRRLGRPSLSEQQISARVAAYCARYRVEPTDTGLPPFPSGRRETRQHREWLALYRAAQRRTRREATSIAGDMTAASDSSSSCGLCGQPLGSAGAAFIRGGTKLRLHTACGELAGAAEAAGPRAVARLSAFISRLSRSAGKAP
jgi:hypothetical protein